jgi:hypothetical protein
MHALTPLEQAELKRLVLKMVVAVVMGTGLLTWFVIVPGMNQAGGPTPPTTAADEVNIVARAPGTDPAFALNFCKDPATTVTRPRFPVPEQNGSLEASRGTDTLTWPGFGVTARYQTSSEGRDIDITPAAVDCLQKKVK